MPMLRVLFLCTGNSCRSQMAEGWARQLRGDQIEPYSAGIVAHGLNPDAVRVMAEAGVDMYHYSQALKLGVSKEDIAQAVELADKVKRAPAQNVLTLADKILGTTLSQHSAEAPDTACCPDSGAAESAKASKGKCCRPRP